MTPRIERQGHGLLILCGSLHSSNDSGFHSFGHEGTVVRLNTTAAAILQLCDGTRTSREIVDCLSDSQGNRDFPVLIEEFLDAAPCAGPGSSNWDLAPAGTDPLILPLVL